MLNRLRDFCDRLRFRLVVRLGGIERAYYQDLMTAHLELVREDIERAARLGIASSALCDIREMTDADDENSYRCDDREGCLDSVFYCASRALDRVTTEDRDPA